MNCDEYRELIAAHVDDVLGPEEESLAAAHLASCEQCTRLLARERRFAQDLRARNLIQPTPPALRARVLAAIATEQQPLSWTAQLMEVLSHPGYRAALAGALAMVMLMLVAPLLHHAGRSEHDVLQEMLEHYRQAEAQTINLEMKTDKPKVLEYFFADKGIEAPTRTVIDLHGLGYKLVGGSVVPLGTAPSAMMLYRADKGFLLCHRARAADLQLPAGGEVVNDDTYYHVDGLSICAYRDGDAICIMASAMSLEDLRKLLAGYI